MCDKLPYNNPRIDRCIQELIDDINNGQRQYKTVSSCCGHGKYDMTIVVYDRLTTEVTELFTGVHLSWTVRLGKKYYVSDKKGHHLIPEVIKHRKGLTDDQKTDLLIERGIIIGRLTG